MIVLHETGQIDRVDCVRTIVGFLRPPQADILDDNPLGKIPALVLDDGRCIFDSRVICEYLDAAHSGERLLPAEGAARIAHLRWQAFGDGITDILLLLRIEYLREHADPGILLGFKSKLSASFKRLELEAKELASTAFGLGQISIVCAIGQLDFRYSQSNWRAAFPALADWHSACSERASVKATAPIDDAAPGPQDTDALLDFMGVQ